MINNNTDNKQDPLSSQAHSADEFPDDEASYGLDIPGESCLGCQDNT